VSDTYIVKLYDEMNVMLVTSNFYFKVN